MKEHVIKVSISMAAAIIFFVLVRLLGGTAFALKGMQLTTTIIAVFILINIFLPVKGKEKNI